MGLYPEQLQDKTIAYFSMEIGIESQVPTYCGGLGILAGDILKSAADLGVPMVGLTLMYHKGYFTQVFDETGFQHEEENNWSPAKNLKLLKESVEVTVEGRNIKLKVWKYEIKGVNGHIVPVYYLDADIKENQPWDRELCHALYKSSGYSRFAQEIVLGIGGVRMLQALGYKPTTYHINEGHIALLTLELLRQNKWHDDEVRKLCVFTTHTPIKAGHETFSYQLVYQLLGDSLPWHIKQLAGEDNLNMTLLALNLSSYTNAVAKKHMDVTRNMFPGYRIDHVTNGIHPGTWVSAEMRQVFARHLPNWQSDPEALAKADNLPEEELWSAHQESKQKLVDYIEHKHGVTFSTDILTIGFARRAAQYKRMGLIFKDLSRLISICENKVQFVFAGKAHFGNDETKRIIQFIIKTGELCNKKIKLVFLENYDIEVAKLMTAGVDIWLNNPQRPHEASGTSGMKAAINGVPNFSVLDGWWIEGYQENVTGWAIGKEATEVSLDVNNDDDDVESFYTKLEKLIIPLYYNNPKKWKQIMKSSIMINGGYFNTHRVVKEYLEKAYLKIKALTFA